MVNDDTPSTVTVDASAAPRRLLVVADLRHASPRWPALLGGLILRGWEVTVVTAPLGADAATTLGFPSAFAGGAHIVEVGPATDVLEPVRRLLWLVGLRPRRSLTEQMKEKMGRPAARSAFDRVFQLGQALWGWPDLQAAWRRPALLAAEALLAAGRFDALVSSSPYPTSHVVAAALKQRHPALRWVADFRDLWADNHNYAMPRWRQALDRVWERRVLRHADAITAPTQGWAAHLEESHHKPAACVPNGFVDYEGEPGSSPAATAASKGGAPAATVPTVPGGRFVLLYAGVRYPANQNILPVLLAIALLRDRGAITAETFVFRWIGPYDSETALEAASLGIEAFVSQEGSVPREAARQAQREAHALLFLQWQDAATDWSSSLKLHEYVGSGPPILAIGGFPESKVSRLLAATGRAALAATATEAAEALTAWITQVREEGAVRRPSDWKSTAVALSGISRGLVVLEKVLANDNES